MRVYSKQEWLEVIIMGDKSPRKREKKKKKADKKKGVKKHNVAQPSIVEKEKKSE